MSDQVALSFPPGFVWGSATASYQIEGAAKEGGRTPSIWDTFSETPGKTLNGDTGAVACDHYHRFQADVALLKELRIPAYRFSISWSRVLPYGRVKPNPEGIAFYNALIDALVAEGIQPLVTLYHWDLPQCLEDEYGGWLGRQIVDDFANYAALCFAAFGDRVKSWLTLNEPWCSTALGYCNGEHAPGRNSAPGTEPYIAGHHMILAHAAAYRRYHSDFAALQQGQVGITVNMDWKEPKTTSAADVAAAQRALDFQLGWFVDPIYKGDYPSSMRDLCGDRLPKFADAEREMVRDSADFFGLNHYSTDYVSDNSAGRATTSMWGSEQSGGYFADQLVNNHSDPAWEKTDMGWDVVPWGLGRMLMYLHRTYAPRGGIWVTENGCAVKEDDAESACNDEFRVRYFQGYIAQVHKAIQDGADVRGYFAWSLMDNFEWGLGYSKRFGIVRVDYATLDRTPKASAALMRSLAETNVLKLQQQVPDASSFSPLSVE
eukprot:TRINITY_DN56974_c0_g1_i1.p1 TRINITY_DN56974_c0_g1~~TRINITY_DN56974_c0_g1_i1.p1  ORF type:complete len:511 (-),score=57.82 TRINITY_DN56974_c0_g1_i1:183-1649(-)